MPNKIKLLSLALVGFSSMALAQVHSKEILNEKDGNTELTISSVAMYEGTRSEVAKKWYNKAIAYNDNEDYANAKLFYLKAINEDPSYVEAYDNLGLVFRILKRYDKAIEYYKKSIDLQSDGAMAHQNLASVYQIKKEYAKAISEYQILVQLDAQNPEGYFGLANCFMMLSKWEDANEQIEKALAIYSATNSPHLGDGNYLAGLINHYKGDKVKAKLFISKAKGMGVNIHPDIEAAVLSEALEYKNIKLEVAADYAKTEQTVIDAFDWLLENPIGKASVRRSETVKFLMRWMTGSPDVSIEIDTDVSSFVEDKDCFVLFMGGWTKYVLTTRDFDTPLKGKVAGIESVVEYYIKNKKAIGKNRTIEKWFKLQKAGKLEAHFRKKK